MSLPVRGAWIEIGRDSEALRRAGWSLPVRGAWIEMPPLAEPKALQGSFPVRGAWIEIMDEQSGTLLFPRRSPCGERGLKYACYLQPAEHLGRSPCGERGLKSLLAAVISSALPCRSPCGERGLKYQARHLTGRTAGRSPCGERGLKSRTHGGTGAWRSRSPCGERGLKYSRPPQRTGANPVAPRAGSVD